MKKPKQLKFSSRCSKRSALDKPYGLTEARRSFAKVIRLATNGGKVLSLTAYRRSYKTKILSFKE